MELRIGEAFVPLGKDASDTARGLLNLARQTGLNPHVVRTTTGGFIVPDELVAVPAKKGETARILPVDPPPEPETSAPRGRRKKK